MQCSTCQREREKISLNSNIYTLARQKLTTQRGLVMFPTSVNENILEMVLLEDSRRKNRKTRENPEIW